MATHHTIRFVMSLRGCSGFAALIQRSVTILAFSLLFSGEVLADYYDGLRAFDSGNYTAAAKEWFTSGSQGDVNSQFRLAQLYEQGLGIPQNFIEAHRWYNLAASQGHAEARTARDKLGVRLTPEQLGEAQRLASETRAQPKADLKDPAMPRTSQPAIAAPSAPSQEPAPIPANLPKRIQEDIGRWADHPFQQLPAIQLDSALWEESTGFKQWMKVIYRARSYVVLERRSTNKQGLDEEQIAVYLGIQRLSAVASSDSGNWNRSTLGFSETKPLQPSSTAKPIGGIRPQDLSVEYNWDIRVGSDERNFHVTWKVMGVTRPHGWIHSLV